MQLLDRMEAFIKEGIEANRLSLDLDDDWEPMLFLANSEKELTVVPFGEMTDGEGGKQLLAEVLIPMVIKKYKATAMVIMFCAWGLKVDAQTTEGEKLESEELIDMLVPPSQHPRRIELLVLLEADQEQQRFLSAEIIRPEGAEHPELSEWCDDGPDDGKFAGLFWEAPVKALRGA